MRSTLSLEDTIFSLASGALPSAVGIIKLCGPKALAIASQVFQPGDHTECSKRGMYFGKLVDEQGVFFDESLALVFVGPNSHTGEDTVEFHCHGSLAIVSKLQSVLNTLGARPAGSGEFTYRALVNGKITAEQVEHLGDVFLSRDASDLMALQNRRAQGLGPHISKLRELLIHSQAVFDTAVDFTEEYSAVVDQAKSSIEEAIRECSQIIHLYERFRSGSSKPRIVLAGLPNAGKSTLFNLLLGRSRALVSPTAGTTRDVVEEDIEIAGRAWKLVDTAGVRSSEDSIEAAGVEMGKEYLRSASVWLQVIDAAEGISTAALSLLEQNLDKPVLVVWNKNDLNAAVPPPKRVLDREVFSVSAEAGTGVEALISAIHTLCGEVIGRDYSIPVTAVQASRLKKVLDSLLQLREALFKSEPPEYLAELNRMSLKHLEVVAESVSTEEVLGRIFSEFCIGK